MAGTTTKERLQQDLTIWYADGIIDEPTLNVLRGRYEARRFGWSGVVKYVGITGGMFAFFGIIGMVAALASSKGAAVVLSGGVGGALTYWALWLAHDIRNRYAVSSKVVLTLGVVLWTIAIGILASLVGMEEGATLLMTGIISLPIGFVLAYRSRNTYLLIIVLLGLFHWIGSWNEMWGRSTYAFSVQDPKVMSLAALAAFGIGLYHERSLYPKLGRFYSAWQSLALVYLNMSLLILSIWGHHEGQTSAWILVFSAATIAQIVFGAFWQSGLVRGFGITFFALNIFTRYHELFWDRMELGLYLLAGGVLLLVAGACTEFFVRKVRTHGGGA